MELKLTACSVIVDNYFDIMNKQFFFSPLYLAVNKLSDYKHATMISFLLAHGVNKWFQADHWDCSCRLN